MTPEPNFILVCEDCGSIERDPNTHEPFLDGYKWNEVGPFLGSAELLKRIHAFTEGHNPYIRTETENDSHVPDSAARTGVPLE